MARPRWLQKESRRIGVVPKSPAVRTAELLGSPGPPHYAFPSPPLEKLCFQFSMCVGGWDGANPNPSACWVPAGAEGCTVPRGLLVVVPIADQVQSRQMCTQHICCSHPMSGKVLGLCWSRISFFPASKAKQKAWVAVSAM